MGMLSTPQSAKKSKAELRESIAEIESKPTPRKEPVFVEGTLPAGALELSVQEVRVAKCLFHTCFQREVEKYPQRYDMTAYASLKDKITVLFNTI